MNTPIKAGSRVIFIKDFENGAFVILKIPVSERRVTCFYPSLFLPKRGKLVNLKKGKLGRIVDTFFVKIDEESGDTYSSFNSTKPNTFVVAFNVNGKIAHFAMTKGDLLPANIDYSFTKKKVRRVSTEKNKAIRKAKLEKRINKFISNDKEGDSLPIF